MKKRLTTLILLICCFMASAQHLKELTETEKKRQAEEYVKRMAELNTGKYFPNKLINEYLGDWESEDKKIRLSVATKRTKVVKPKPIVGKAINAEFDALIIKITHLNSRDTIYTEADLGEPITLISDINDEVYFSDVKDVIKDRNLTMTVSYIEKDKLLVKFNLIDRLFKGSSPHATVFPTYLFNLIRKKE